MTSQSNATEKYGDSHPYLAQKTNIVSGNFNSLIPVESGFFLAFGKRQIACSKGKAKEAFAQCACIVVADGHIHFLVRRTKTGVFSGESMGKGNSVDESHEQNKRATKR